MWHKNDSELPELRRGPGRLGKGPRRRRRREHFTPSEGLGYKNGNVRRRVRVQTSPYALYAVPRMPDRQHDLVT